MDVAEIMEWTKDGMQKGLESLKRDYGTIRTGKVGLSVLDGVRVEYYGEMMGLSNVATLATPDASTITVTPWEKPMLKEIEKAIQAANIGVTPSNNGEAVRLNFPPMTTDQRKESAKKAKAMTENAKVALRNVRRDANDKVKKLEKDKLISEDESKKAQEQIQKVTDEYIKKADEANTAKEAEIMKI